MRDWFFTALVAALCSVPVVARAEADEAKRFEQHIRPLLASQCIKCHGPAKQEGGLRLDSREAMLAGGDSGPVLVPGEIEESLIVEAVRYESYEMPPAGKLPDAEIAQLVDWIAAGAVWPEHGEPIREAAGQISDSDRQWWAFQPLQQPEVPQVAGDDWSRTEIDRFVYQRLAEHEMTPAPQASKQQLLRRLYYDLVGVPPTPAETAAFLADDSPAAWEQLIDQLLDDERYGEHWGRYWLDLVRYAESDGWNQDAYRPHIWRYRDYVVRSFNQDKPYPQFVREQLAGDEIPGGDPEALTATGYLRLGIYEYNQRDARSHWNDIMNEITDVTADVFLGMGMACARCHDHKFDPILQKDYFRLRAFFEPLIWRDDVPQATPEQLAEYEAQLAQWQAATVEVQAQIDALLQPYHDRRWRATVDMFPLEIQACFHKPVEQRTSWEHQMAYLIGRQFSEEGGGPLRSMTQADKDRHEELKKQLAEFDHLKPQPLPALMTAADFPYAHSPTVIADHPDAEPIEPGYLTVLCDGSPAELEPLEARPSSGRRTALAQWIGRADNPLTTRVIVNRIWQQHFGQGIVPTASDFGRLGRRPTHPELLDWLTLAFIDDGWSLKKLHKRILLSAVWQQSSLHPQAAEYQMKDPGDDLLWRFRVNRLTAEQIRDSALVASGELKQQLGGPSIAGSEPRRSLYVKFQRNNPDTFLQLFDIANGLVSIAERNKTTTPVQSLMMLNGNWMLQRAEKMAARLQAQQVSTTEELLTQAFALAWGREPDSEERSRAQQFVGEPLDADRLVDLCHVLLNSNEFLYID